MGSELIFRGHESQPPPDGGYSPKPNKRWPSRRRWPTFILVGMAIATIVFAFAPKATTTTTTPAVGSAMRGFVGGKGRYKLWALAAILLLAFWSMLTGTVSLKWSACNLTRFSDAPIHDDLDVLEVEEREKVVRHMWDVYTYSRRIRLLRLWQAVRGRI